MARKSKYKLMNSSSVTDENGNNYPDLATFPINDIRATVKPAEYKLNQNNLTRFFNLAYEWYGSFDFYDTLTLWLNGITDITDNDNFGKTVNFYGKNDLDKWYVEHMKSE